MSKPLIHLVAGARPNFMKIAPLVRALRADGRLAFRLVHTGQHHDREMSGVFFEELGIPPPDVRLGVSGGSHAALTGAVMLAYEALCLRERPAAVVVVGDVNSTLACALAAKKLQLPVAHVEAGLRSGDRAMPEEINRLATDAISDWLFATEPGAVAHLLREGQPADRIFPVGQVMVDNLLYQVARLDVMDTAGLETDAFKRAHGRYGVVTLHRPANVDEPRALERIATALRAVSRELPLAFPAHPRTRERLQRHGVDLGPGVTLMPPLPYMAFLHLWRHAAVVLTDSGGMQEETTALGVPCVTVRENTERPITIAQGSNVLAGTEPAAVTTAALAAACCGARRGQRPPLWDGRAAERIVAILAVLLGATSARPAAPAAPLRPRVDLLGCRVDDLTMEETLKAIGGLIASGGPHQHVVVNVDKIVKASRSPELRRIIGDCAIVNADGMPVVWASWLLGRPLRERVTGVDLFQALAARAAQAGWSVYLLGAREEVVRAVAETLVARHPGLRIAGWRNGYWGREEEPLVAETIRLARPDILFVAMGSPAKEEFLGRWLGHMAVPFAMGVGGSFDVVAGRVRRAPRWMQHSGLEWFYRFLQEPRRMFRRYFVDSLGFFVLLARDMWRERLRKVALVMAGALAAAWAFVNE
jgi:UDP-N-acetylglucosamine 2-epimerase (non-hydrolysing)